ncbi:MAG: hypothetical protein GY862_16985, partial [Gammaproteobacteria bacterium]|nr:hypothetical protein [Gammaproteobacteria bacterium]
MARKLVLVLTLIVTFYTTGAHALGMGNIAVQSKLNQPLLAKIKLMSIPRGQIGSIKVSLASREAFDRAGLERPHLLSTMRYKVIQAKNKRSATIRITTSQPIKEPFLNFLLEVNWPSGRLLREYTVLLDPPVFSSKRKPAPLQVPTAQRTPLPRTPLPSPPAPAKPPAPAVTLSMPAERRVRAVPSAPRIHAYTTVKNDTLWVIAKRMMADNPSMSHHQMMVMLFEANQHAFIRGNMNRLKTGQNLNIPAPEAATGMSQKSALRVFREHDAVWRGYRRSVAATPTRTPRTAARRAKAAGMKTASVGEPTAFFQVRPAFTKRGKDAGAAETPPVEDNSSTELGKMRAELAGLRKINTGLQEENTRIQLKNKQLDEDLKATRDVVEDLNSKVNKLITVQNNLYERLQEQIAQLGTLKGKQPTDEIQKTGNEILSKFERPGQPPVESEPAAPQPAGSESEPVESEPAASQPAGSESEPVESEPAASQPAGAESEPVESEPAAPQPAGSESEPVESEPAASQPAGSESEPVESESAAPQPAGSESEEPVESEPAAPQPAEPAAESWINAVPGGWLTLGGVLAAVAGVGGLFGFRKLRKKKQQAEAQQGEEELKALEEAGMLPETGAAGAEGAPASGDAAAAGTADTQPDENIMEEVDVFIAYERFDQAGNIIDSAIEKHPEHHPYLLKRLEVDATANDAASFEQHAQKLHSAVQGKGPLWEQAQSLWQGMGTGTPLLGGTAASDTAGGAGTAAAVGAAALGAAAVGAAAAGAMGETEPAEDMDMGMGMGEDESMDFDIDLDSLDADDSGDAGMGAEAGAADQADDELDFDLNLDSEEGVEELSMDLNAGEEVPAADDEGLNFDLEESPGAEAGDDLSLDMDLGETGEPGEQASDAGDELNFDLDEGGLGEDASALDESMELDTADEQTAGEGLEFDLEGAGEAEAPGLDETGAEDGLSLDMDLGEAGLTEEPGLDAAEEGLSLDMDLGEEQPGDAGLTEEPGLDAAEEGLSLDMDLGEEQP